MVKRIIALVQSTSKTYPIFSLPVTHNYQPVAMSEKQSGRCSGTGSFRMKNI